MSSIAAEPEAKPAAVAPRMVLALGLAGLLAGLFIVVVYEATLPMIEANRAHGAVVVQVVLPGRVVAVPGHDIQR